MNWSLIGHFTKNEKARPLILGHLSWISFGFNTVAVFWAPNNAMPPSQGAFAALIYCNKEMSNYCNVSMNSPFDMSLTIIVPDGK